VARQPDSDRPVDNRIHLRFITAYVDNWADFRRSAAVVRADRARLPGQEALAAVLELEVLDDELDDEPDDEPDDVLDEPDEESDEPEEDDELDSVFFSAEPLPLDTPEPARLSVR
jgi:hypothetical protein